METKIKIITLLSGACNIKIDPENSNDTITTVIYDSPVWPEKKCIYQVPGKCEIKSIQKNIVSLKQIIPEPEEIEFMPVKINVPIK